MQPALGRRFERLEAARSRLLGSLAGCDAAALNRSPAPGRWSPLQVLHHVVTVEGLTVGYVRKKMQAGAALPRAGVTSRLRLLLLQATLASPLRVRAPAGTATVPATGELPQLQVLWDEVRGDLARLLGSFPAELLDRLVFRHPYAGRMSLEHALGMLQAHFDHHARQVEAALRGRQRQ